MDLFIKSKLTMIIIQSIISFIIYIIIKKIGIAILSTEKDYKKKYFFIQLFKLVISVILIVLYSVLWLDYFSDFMTFITYMSAALTLSLKDFVFNFFAGLYIKISKVFTLEDRIEINGKKGDVVNFNNLTFDLLEVNNDDYLGQSTGVIVQIPNSYVFTNHIKNYNKGFKYIWDEIKIKLPLDVNIEKTKKILLDIVNNNETIAEIPVKMENAMQNATNEFRIYYNNYNPVIYTKLLDNCVELEIRYLMHHKKLRIVNSQVTEKILEAVKNKKINIYTA